MRLSAPCWFALAGLVIGLGASPCQAQMHVGLYAEGSGATLRINGSKPVYGSTFGFYLEKDYAKASLGGDFRGVMMGSGNAQGAFSDERLDYGLFGARLASKSLFDRLTPYIEGLAGMGYFREGVGITRQDATSGSLHAVGGVDVKIHGNLEWRAVEVDYGRVRGQLFSSHPITVSSGIVFEFP